MATKVPVLNKEGKETEEISVPEGVFGNRVNTAVIHQAVVKYRASLRQGNASTKERADVKGSGVKPFRQKGTGRARAGTRTSPLWAGGGITFGPHKRDFSYTVPKKIRVAALRESINAKIQKKDLHCIADLTEAYTKTKEFAGILKALNLKGKTLAMLDGSDPSIPRVSKNIRSFELIEARNVNALDVLNHKNILLTKTAFNQLVERIQK